MIVKVDRGARFYFGIGLKGRLGVTGLAPAAAAAESCANPSQPPAPLTLKSKPNKATHLA
ncbi:MAG TPA: hypothetical protein VGG72_21100 [Bryobacteraceae bacterium]|jgi:hypothetical protein